MKTVVLFLTLSSASIVAYCGSRMCFQCVFFAAAKIPPRMPHIKSVQMHSNANLNIFKFKSYVYNSAAFQSLPAFFASPSRVSVSRVLTYDHSGTHILLKLWAWDGLEFLKKRLRAVRQSRTENSRNWSSSFIMFHILCKIDLSLSEHILACLTVAVGLSSFCFKHLQTLKTIVAEPLHLGLSAFAAAGVIQPLPQRGAAALFQLWKYCCLEIESIFVWSLNGLVVVIQDLN